MEDLNENFEKEIELAAARFDRKKAELYKGFEEIRENLTHCANLLKARNGELKEEMAALKKVLGESAHLPP